jgi:hypothetical protein
MVTSIFLLQLCHAMPLLGPCMPSTAAEVIVVELYVPEESITPGGRYFRQKYIDCLRVTVLLYRLDPEDPKGLQRISRPDHFELLRRYCMIEEVPSLNKNHHVVIYRQLTPLRR